MGSNPAIPTVQNKRELDKSLALFYFYTYMQFAPMFYKQTLDHAVFFLLFTSDIHPSKKRISKAIFFSAEYMFYHSLRTDYSPPLL